MSTAGRRAAVVDGVWRRHRVKFLAILVVALLAWLYYYLQYMPIARDFSSEDSKLIAVNRERAVRLGGIAAGDVVTFRLVAARRLTLSLSPRAVMRSPDLAPFLAKASADAPALAGFSCPDGAILLEARTAADESASVAVSLAGDSAAASRPAALLLQKAAANRYKNGLLLQSEGLPQTLVIDFNSSGNSPAGRMVLCRSGKAAILGHAEFEVPPGEPVVAEFLDVAPGADRSVQAAAFDFPGINSQLPVSSIASGLTGDDGSFATKQIACSAAGRNLLWRKFLPDVRLSDCTAATLHVSGFEFDTGELAVSPAPAFFKNFQDSDSARFVSRAMSNLIVQWLIAALVSGSILPWAIGQFRKKRAPQRRRK